ncbi:polysaccharide deacetylase family protein [Isoptericola sp. AK164]|uniref:polysaccharide deacetylase family protein n=1 Tax=Isoptericola sp. AK164 TaxID=3024246 RepID=UPI002418B5C6|nr:polysaccharide deacetylase family protein [Isoptericola sp. AK164]
MSTSPDPGAPAPARRRRARWWWLGGTLVLLLTGAAFVAAELEHRAWVEAVAEYEAEVARVTEEAETSRARAEEAYADGLATLTGAIDQARPVYRASEDQVADPAVRDPLDDALAEGRRLRDAEVAYPVETRTVEAVTRPNPFFAEELPAVTVEVVDAAQPDPAALESAATDLVTTADTVATARREWAVAELRPATDEGRYALTGLRAQDADLGLGTLDDAVTEAEAVLDAGVDAVDPDEAVALRDTLLETSASLWRTRLDQITAERRAAARADGVDCRVDQCVALTFDDGPVAETERLLRILERKDAPATFFMVGDNVAKNPQIARAVADGGHLVANHSWSHPQLTTLGDAAVREELRSTSEAIADATGTTPFLLRPPYGDVDGRVRTLATRTGLDVMTWNLDTLDWQTRDAKETRRAVRQQVEPGSNVLMHDIHATTVDAVGKIIKDLRDEDYVLVTADLLVEDED